MLAALADPGVGSQIGYARWQQDFPDGADWFPLLLSGSAIRTGANLNYALLDDARVDALIDRASGIWRSRDAGASWQKIWAVKDNAEFEGFLAADPDDPTGGTIVVTLGRKGSVPGTWRLRGCQVAGATVENGQIVRTYVGSTRFDDLSQRLAEMLGG